MTAISRRYCKTCRQPLATPAAVQAVRNTGRHHRKLTNAQRRKLRQLLVKRELKLREAGAERITGWSMRAIADKCGCERRTAIRELEWLRVDGTLEKALKKAGFAR